MNLTTCLRPILSMGLGIVVVVGVANTLEIDFIGQVFGLTGINRTINFQGKLQDSDNLNVTDDDYTVVFTIYNHPTGGTALWTETQTVTTVDGVFRVALGSQTAIPSNMNFNWDGLYLGMKVGSDDEMTPRIRLTAVPYAFNSEKVAGLTVTNESGVASTSGTLRIPDGKVVSFGGAFATSGTAGLTLTVSNTTNATLPEGTITLVDTNTSQTLTSKLIGSTGLTFSGASTDITTGTDEDLTLVGNGTGIISLNDTVRISTLTNNKGLVFLDDASGTLTSLANGTTGDCLKANTSAAPSWGTCGVTGGSSNWILNSTDGILRPINNTLDLLIGGTATASADFAVLNVNGSGPVIASVSGNLIVMPKNGAGGNVGIGTTDPTSLLEVVKNHNSVTSFVVRNQAEPGNTSAQAAFQLITTGNSGGMYAYPADAGTGRWQDRIVLKSDSNSAGFSLESAASGQDIRFYAGSTDESMRIDSNGNVGIGTTEPTTKLSVSGTANTIANGSIFSLTGSLTGTAGGQYGARFIPSVSPGSASTRTYAAAEFGPTSSSNNLENASFVGFIGKPYYSGSGTVGTVVGGDFYYELDGSGTIDSGFGVYVENPAKSGGTINNNRGLQIDAQTAGTSNIGLVIGEATGTRNTNLLIGTTSQPVGSYSIYNSSADENYFAGNLGIGVSTSISGKLHVMSDTVTDLMRIGYDASNYFSAQVSSAGAVTFNAVGGSAGFTFSDPMTLGIAGSANGSLTFQSSGSDIDPATITMDSSGNLTIQATQTGASLVLGDGTGDIRFTPGTDNIVMNLNSTGDLLIQDNGTTYAIFNDSGNVGFGTTAPTSQLFVTRPLTFGATGKALAVFDQIENQDILTASASGTPRFTITRDGGIKLGTDEGSNGNCLLSGGAGAAATWGSCGSGGGAPNTKNTSGSGDVALSTSETSFASLSITPSSASNEILVIAKITAYSTTTQDRTTTLRIRRGADCSATQVGTDAESVSTNSSADDYMDIYAARIDAPATTASITYQLCVVSSGSNINVDYWDLTLMEVSEGADYAELYNTNDSSLSQGDVVVLDHSLISGVKKSSKVYDSSVIGIVSTRPNMVIGAGARAGVNAVPIALAGRVPVKVSTENGLIRPGDFLTSSSVPGVAMKATKAGWVIGQAMTGFEGSNTGEVMVFVKTSWYDPGTDFSELEGLTIVSDMRKHEVRIAELEKLFASENSRLRSDNTLTVTLHGNQASFVPDDTTRSLTPLNPIRDDDVLSSSDSADQILTNTDKILNQFQDNTENLLGVNYIDTFTARQATISANFRVQGDGLFEGILSVIESITTNNLYVSGLAHFFGEVVFKGNVSFDTPPTFSQDTAGYVVVKKGQKTGDVVFAKEYDEIPVINASIISEKITDEQFDLLVKSDVCKKDDREACQDLIDERFFETAIPFVITKTSPRGFSIRLREKAAQNYTFSWSAIAVRKKEMMTNDAELDRKAQTFMRNILSKE